MPRSDDRPRWLRYSGLGLELVGAVAVLGGLGWWIDQSAGSEPWGLLTGALVGIVIGMTSLIRQALLAMRESTGDDGPGRPERD